MTDEFDSDKAMFWCHGGPFTRSRIALGHDARTLVFKVGHWHGRYVCHSVDTVVWEAA